MTKLGIPCSAADAQHTLVSGQAQQIFFFGALSATAGSSILTAVAAGADGSSRFCCQNSQPIHAPWPVHATLVAASSPKCWFPYASSLQNQPALALCPIGSEKASLNAMSCNVTLHGRRCTNTPASFAKCICLLLQYCWICILVIVAMSASKEEVAQGIKVAQQEMEYKVDLYNR